MAISAGDRLGSYELLGPLGASGMGEVWRARDSRLSRDVAIKVLPADLAGDPSRLKRFEKEAHAASALNHPNIVTIYEVRVLMSHWHGRNTLMTRVSGESVHRDLSWLDTSYGADLSDDGRTLLMSEQGEGAASLSYSVWLRKTDGSDAVLLGNGLACGLSPDGKWALAVRVQPPPAQLVLLPTGAGEERVITHDAISHRMASWFPDGKRVVFIGTETGKAPRLYVQNVDGGAAKPITPELAVNFWVRRPISPDGQRVVAREGGNFWLYPVEGGNPSPVARLVRGQTPIRWSADGRFLYVRESPGPPIKISRLDPMTGVREPWEEIPELSGEVLLSADGRSHAITSQIESSDLYLVEGLR